MNASRLAIVLLMLTVPQRGVAQQTPPSAGPVPAPGQEAPEAAPEQPVVEGDAGDGSGETEPTPPAAGADEPTSPVGHDGLDPDSAPADGALADEEAAIAAELAAMGTSAADGSATPQPAPTPASPAGGLSNLMNPAISVNGVVYAGGTTRGNRQDGAEAAAADHTDEHGHGFGDLQTGIQLQEVELRLSSNVDPYFRADATLAAHADEIGFEEAFVTTLALPRTAIRAGQMYANLGRHNLLHTHAFPFVSAPLPWRALLGPDGLNDPGLSIDTLLPVPFFLEVNAQAFRGEWRAFSGDIEDDPDTEVDESVPDRRRDGDLAYLWHLKALFDLGSPTTVELGMTYVGGRNGFGRLTQIVAGDLTLKWRPIAAARYTSFDWTTEYLWVERRGDAHGRRTGGGYTGLRFQFDQRWWVQVRGALLGLPEGASVRTYRGEALVGFIPSEFSAVRLQYAIDAVHNDDAVPVHEVFLQTVFSIGSHPAHAY